MLIIHFMTINSPIFNIELIKLINSNFNNSEHLFILSNHENYNMVREYKNCIYDKDIISLNKLNYYSDKSDYIILHSNPYNNFKLIFIKKNIARKIVWCIWGSDLYQKYEFNINQDKNILYNIMKYFYIKFIKKILNNIADRKIKLFQAIVIGYNKDKIEINKRFGINIKVMNALYGSGYYKEDVDKVTSQSNTKKDELRVMIGHSAFDFLKHKKYIDKLSVYKDKNIKIILFLSYGDKAYADSIEKYAKNIFKDKVEVYRDFMPSNKYIQILSTIDIAIFDFEHQAAFGNMILLLYLGVKLYLSTKGIMALGLKKEKIKINNCEDIGKISFEDLCKSNKDNILNSKKYSEKLLNKEKLIKQWRNVFKYLKEVNR